jgi:hypothetical protein
MRSDRPVHDRRRPRSGRLGNDCRAAAAMNTAARTVVGARCPAPGRAVRMLPVPLLVLVEGLIAARPPQGLPFRVREHRLAAQTGATAGLHDGARAVADRGHGRLAQSEGGPNPRGTWCIASVNEPRSQAGSVQYQRASRHRMLTGHPGPGRALARGDGHRRAARSVVLDLRHTHPLLPRSRVAASLIPVSSMSKPVCFMIGCVENNHDHEGLRATCVRGARTPTASRSVTGKPARRRRTPSTRPPSMSGLSSPSLYNEFSRRILRSSAYSVM